MYIKLTNGTPEKYSIRQLRLDNPQVSFPKDMSDAALAEYRVFPLSMTEPPAHDPITQNVVEGAPSLMDGTWVQTWSVEGATAEQVFERKVTHNRDMENRRAEDYKKFSDPLFFKWQRGGGTEEDWLLAVQQVKELHPYVE